MPRRLNALGYFLAQDLRLEMKMEMQMQQPIGRISAPVSHISSSSPLI
jgi:hypothetical protein